MQIRADSLETKLQRGELLPVYLISGDELLLMQEACDLVRNSAREQGYLERSLYHVDAKFNWDQLVAAAQSRSLFSEKKLIELRLTTTKLGIKGSKALVQYCSGLSAEVLLLISIPKLSKSEQSNKWVKAVDSVGGWVQLWPISPKELPNWIVTRLRKVNIKLDREALSVLCEQVQGNLLAAHQEILKLQLDTDASAEGTSSIDAASILSKVVDNARFNVFQLLDSSLQGELEIALRALYSLRQEGVVAIIIASTLTREIEKLAMLAELPGERLDDRSLYAQGIWKSRHNLVRKSLRRLSSDTLHRLLQHCKYIDSGIKGLYPVDVFLELDNLICELSGQPVRTEATQQRCLLC